eukprot:6290114-Heterocapsa_arctica.AAC.1
MELIIADEVRRVVNKVVDEKAKGFDARSPAELRALSQTHIQGLADILNNVEEGKRWPEGMNPPKDGAGHEGQLRPIAMLPYIYR